MAMLNKVFSRSSALLKLSRCKVGDVKHCAFRNTSNSSKLFACSSVDAFEDKKPGDNLKEHQLSENVTLDSLDSERLTSDVFTKAKNKNVESNYDIVKMHNEMERISDIEVLDGNEYDFSDALVDLDEKLPGPFDPCTEDLSYIGSHIQPTYNFAKFADESYTLQQLVNLGVKLYKLEKDREVVKMFLSLDFDKHMKPYIRFLTDCGVQSDNLGSVITKNPKIFKEDMDDLHTRIRYLRAHNFTPEMISIITTSNPKWLSFKTKELDERLGYLQHNFSLNGFEVRWVAVGRPRILTHGMKELMINSFAIKEEMGFDKKEAKLVLFRAPATLTRASRVMVNSFDYLHNEVGYPHIILSQEPTALLCRKRRIETRHKFLVELKRDQFNPKNPLYVSPKTLVGGDDVTFCNNVAKASIHIYNDFLKFS